MFAVTVHRKHAIPKVSNKDNSIKNGCKICSFLSPELL
jgi:hypothetical protein